MRLYQKKRWLIMPECARPWAWPRNTPFPPEGDAMPPGWPRPSSYQTRLRLNVKPAMHPGYGFSVSIECLDEYDEPTDELCDEMILLTAKSGDADIRVRRTTDDPWSKAALVLCEDCERFGFGFFFLLHFETARAQKPHILFTAEVWGVKDGPRATYEMPIGD